MNERVNKFLPEIPTVGMRTHLNGIESLCAEANNGHIIFLPREEESICEYHIPKNNLEKHEEGYRGTYVKKREFRMKDGAPYFQRSRKLR